MAELFSSLIYQPIYNALAFLVGVFPGGNVGLAIIVLTVLIKLALFPLSLSAIRTQIVMREIDPEMKRIRASLKEKPEELARQTLALFKKHRVNPLASVALILLQLPIIIGLYFVFLNEGSGAGFDPALLYTFIAPPPQVSFNFLGIDLTAGSAILALLVGASQYAVGRMMMPAFTPASNEPSFQNDFMRSMHIQMRYVFPVVMAVVSYIVAAAVSLYFLISNLFAIGQELYVRRAKQAAENT